MLRVFLSGGFKAHWCTPLVYVKYGVCLSISKALVVYVKYGVCLSISKALVVYVKYGVCLSISRL